MTRSYRTSCSCMLTGLSLASLACSSPTASDNGGPGNATVQGQVTSALGGSIPNTTVRIACPGVAAVVVATDAVGRYITNLETSASSLTLTSNRVSCHFSEPAEGTARVQLDAELGFVRGPVLVALQTVNLQEP